LYNDLIQTGGVVMKRLLAVWLCSLALMAGASAQTGGFQMDQAATAAAAWKVGQVTAKGALDMGEDDPVPVYRKFLGVTTEGYFLVQDFYQQGDKKLTDPFQLELAQHVDSVELLGVVIVGPFVSWHPNGQMASRGTFRGGMEMMDGKWQWWHTNGKLSGEAMYRDGVEESVRYWDEQGNPVDE